MSCVYLWYTCTKHKEFSTIVLLLDMCVCYQELSYFFPKKCSYLLIKWSRVKVASKYSCTSFWTNGKCSFRFWEYKTSSKVDYNDWRYYTYMHVTYSHWQGSCWCVAREGVKRSVQYLKQHFIYSVCLNVVDYDEIDSVIWLHRCMQLLSEMWKYVLPLLGVNSLLKVNLFH